MNNRLCVSKKKRVCHVPSDMYCVEDWCNAGRDINFEYPEYELSRDMLSSNGKLRLQVAELEEQIDALESDTIRLRKALKNQVACIFCICLCVMTVCVCAGWDGWRRRIQVRWHGPGAISEGAYDCISP